MRSIALVALSLAAAAGCTRGEDDRPRTLAFITEAILAPTCGKAECHSTFAEEKGYVFDTVAASRVSIIGNSMLYDGNGDYATDPTTSYLIQDIITGVEGTEAGEQNQLIRMPYDAPMPNEDVYLLEDWIAAGGEGANCVPTWNNATACDGTNIVKCGADGNFSDEIVTACAKCSVSKNNVDNGGDLGCN